MKIEVVVVNKNVVFFLLWNLYFGASRELCYYQKFMKVDSSLIGTLLKADIGNCVIAH